MSGCFYFSFPLPDDDEGQTDRTEPAKAVVTSGEGWSTKTSNNRSTDLAPTTKVAGPSEAPKKKGKSSRKPTKRSRPTRRLIIANGDDDEEKEEETLAARLRRRSEQSASESILAPPSPIKDSTEDAVIQTSTPDLTPTPSTQSATPRRHHNDTATDSSKPSKRSRRVVIKRVQW